MSDPRCFGCGSKCPADLCTCGKPECVAKLGETARHRELLHLRLYRAGLSRGLELAKEHAGMACGSPGEYSCDIDWSAADEAVAKEGK